MVVYSALVRESVHFLRRSPALLAAVLLVLHSAVASAQSSSGQTADDDALVVAPYLINVTRRETWSFFDPPPGGGVPDYAFYGNRATLGVRVSARRLEAHGAFQYAQLVGLPKDSSGPGPLGAGAEFYAAARWPKAYQLYFKAMSLRVKNVLPGLSIEGGRLAYESGAGTAVAGRLIGNADWTMFERAFDGARADYTGAGWRAHVSFLMPTQGAYEESASPTMSKVRIGTGTWSRGGFQAFAHDYRDTRPVRARPDNTGRRVEGVDVHVQTLGAFHGVRVGGLDLHAWGALQRGDWYGDSHRAFSAVAGAGYRWTDAAWHPAVSGGIAYASGDGDPNDRRHGTFFPMVPTTRPDVLGGTYAQMNLRDLYARMQVRPGRRLILTSDVHRLSLAQSLDRWYSGTGATASTGRYFGYSTRQSRLATGLGTVMQVSAEAALARYWSVKASGGLVKGGEVVTRQFDGAWLSVFSLESRIEFR